MGVNYERGYSVVSYSDYGKIIVYMTVSEVQ